MSDGQKCSFCSGSAEREPNSNYAQLFFVKCQTCGPYFINVPLGDFTKLEELSLNHRVALSAQTIKESSSVQRLVWVFKKDRVFDTDKLNKVKVVVIDDFERMNVRHSNKLDDILKLVAKKTVGSEPFEVLPFTLRDMFSIYVATPYEMSKWLTVLAHEELIDVRKEKIILYKSSDTAVMAKTLEENKLYCGLTPKGWVKVEHLEKGLNSKRVFIAMSFDSEERPGIEKAIREACEETGWDAFPIDKEEYLGGISDTIIAKINESAFIVADFTDNRHGVYYEAGYADGLGIPVVYTVKKAETKDLHFDTRHLNHIDWSDCVDLKTRLNRRIRAVINREHDR